MDIIDEQVLMAALERTRLKERAHVIARLLFLEGVSMAETARRVGVSREAVRLVKGRVSRALRDMVGAPSNWEVLTVVAPPEVASDIRRMCQEGKTDTNI